MDLSKLLHLCFSWALHYKKKWRMTPRFQSLLLWTKCVECLGSVVPLTMFCDNSHLILGRTSWMYSTQNCPYFELQIPPMKLETLTNHEKSWVWRIPKWLHASPPNICHHFHQCLNFGWKHRKKIWHDSILLLNSFSFVLFIGHNSNHS